MDLQITTDYYWTLGSLCIMSFTCVVSGAVFAGGPRSKYMDEDFMKKFDEVHKKHYPKDKSAPKNGYPDHGNGFYSQELTYKGWYDMNIGQRIHYNFLE